MKIPTSRNLCELAGVKTAGSAAGVMFLLLAVVFSVGAETNGVSAVTSNTVATASAPTNAVPAEPTSVASSAATEKQAQGFDEASFRIVSERNIFNANRSGGSPQRSGTFSQRPRRTDSFALVGTMAYDKGAFAFFEGSNSELTKVLKPDGLIAGHKLVEVYADSVKMDVEGKEIKLSIGSQLRREDEGTWHVAEGGSNSYSSGGGSNGSSGGDSSRYGSRSDRSSGGRSSDRSRRDYGSQSENGSASAAPSAPPATASTEDPSEVLKRMMERRAKEDQ